MKAKLKQNPMPITKPLVTKGMRLKDPVASQEASYSLIHKIGAGKMSGPARFLSAHRRLEDELQSQLDGAIAAGAEHGIEGSGVRSGAAAAEGSNHGRIGESRLAIVAGAAVRIGEDGVVEHIERLGAELRPDLFAEFEAFGDGQINVAETGIPEDIAAHRAKRAGGVRNQKRLTVEASITAAGTVRD